MIRLTSVSKYYPGKVPGIIDLSLEIPDGEFLFLIGPSGSGKTTLLRILIRELIPTSGSVEIDSWNLARFTHNTLYHLRRKVGVVYQDFKLLIDRTIYENVAMVPEILGKSEKEVRQSVNNVLELVGLADKANVFPLQLSPGEMQRAGIARAIVGGPKILLADEPTGNLDPETAWGIIDILEEINALGTTVIIASHNAEIVNKLKRRTLTIEHGRVVRDEAKGHYHVVKHEKRESKGGKHDAAH